MALSDPLGILRQLYPNARVTSTRRDPNSALGRANPHSYHNIGQAFDVAPIPGVSFGDYVNNLKSNGVPVVEALDEATSPKPWTTGPNWHIAFGGSQVAPRKPRTLADIAKPDLNTPAPITGLDAQPAQPQMTLADLTQQMPQGDIPAPHHSKFNAGNVLGVLGDALMAYGGLKPEFGPRLAQQQSDERQMAFDREKLNAQLEVARQKALEPPAEVQTAAYWDNLRRTDPGQFARLMTTMDTYNPKTTIGPQGEQIVPRVQTQVLDGRVYHKIAGQWVEEVQ